MGGLRVGDRGAALYNLHADRGATLVFNGSADEVVAMDQTGGASFFEDLRKRWSEALRAANMGISRPPYTNAR